MSLYSDMRARLRSLFGGTRADQDSVEEFQFHLEMETQKYRNRGLSDTEARRRAYLAFGSTASARETTRDARGVRWIEDTLRDIRYSIQHLLHAPGFSVVAIFTLALGIGTTTAIFSVIDGVLTRPAPFVDPDRLVVIWEQDRQSGTFREPSSWPDLQDLRTQASTLTDATALQGTEITYSPDQGAPVRVSGMRVNPQFFSLVGITPLLGREFTVEEDQAGGPGVVLLGESFWRATFAADSAILGETIRLDGTPVQVIGVLPSGVDFGLNQIHARADYTASYAATGEVNLWLPIQTNETLTSRFTHPYLVLARLAPDVTFAAAQEEVTRIGTRLEETYPRANEARGMDAERLDDTVFGPIRPTLTLLSIAVVLLLLVASVNVANLLLARGISRTRELAVRCALGAGTGRLSRQVLIETLLLTLVGAIAGIGVATLGLKTLLALAPADIPRIGSVGVNGRALGLSLGLGLLVGLGFGLIPALKARAVNVMDTVRGTGPTLASDRRHSRMRQLLVAVELALSVTLVVSAGLLIRSFQSVLQVDPGFTAHGVLKAEYQLPTARYPRNFDQYPNFAEIHSFNSRLLNQIRQIPGVTTAALSGSHPLDRGFTNSFTVVGREDESADWPEISIRGVSDDYFRTMLVSLRVGRTFTDGDGTSSPPVVIINQAASERFFGDRDPIGQELRFWGTNRQIVGVIANERIHGLTATVPPAAYTPLTQTPFDHGALLVRTDGDPIAVAGAVQNVFGEIDPALAIYGLEPFEDTVLASVSGRRFTMFVLAAFAGVTLLLSLVGIHGVLSYMTAQRTRELGIRLALGATPPEVVGLVMRGGLWLATVGVVVGLIGAILGTRLMAGMLYGIAPMDPLTFLGVPLLMLVASAAAIWFPARRAARINPTEALRIE